MIEVGRICFKIAGREAGKPVAIIDVIDKNYAMIDGLARRKKCNISHLMPTDMILKIKKNAPTADVHKAMIEANIISEVPKKGEPRPKKEKATRQHLMREKQAKEEKPKKEAAKKEEKPAKKEDKPKEAKKEAKAPAKKEDKPKKEAKKSDKSEAKKKK